MLVQDIEKRLIEVGKKKKDIAESCGLSQQMLYHKLWKNRRSDDNWKVGDLRKIAEVLNMELVIELRPLENRRKRNGKS